MKISKNSATMNTEYISLNSRISLRKGVITENKFKVDIEVGFTRFIAFVAMLVLAAFCTHRIFSDKNYFYILQLGLIIIWLAPHVKRVYDFLFIKTWRSSIRIADIRSVTFSKLENGLETQVTLHLINGRKKVWIFRDAEKQLEEFIRSLDGIEIVEPTPQTSGSL